MNLHNMILPISAMIAIIMALVFAPGSAGNKTKYVSADDNKPVTFNSNLMSNMLSIVGIFLLFIYVLMNVIPKQSSTRQNDDNE